jgi:hypothetical protein
MDAFEKIVIAISNAMERLTLQKIVLTFAMGLIASLLIYVYEHRDIMFDKLMMNPNMSLIFVGALVLFVLGWVFTVLISKVNAKNDDYIKSLEQRLDDAIKREVVSDAAYKALLEKAVMYNGPKRRSYDGDHQHD